jgi:hypothetical protein
LLIYISQRRRKAHEDEVGISHFEEI